jgi:MipA family protein
LACAEETKKESCRIKTACVSKIMIRTLSILLFTITLISPAYADTTEELTEVYTDAGAPAADQAMPSGLHGILGAGLFSGQRIIGKGGVRTVPIPIILMLYKDTAYWSIGGGGVWLLQTDDRSLRLGAGVRVQGGWAPDDDPELVGMQKRKGSLDGYVNGVWRTPLVAIGAHYYHDIANVSRSNAANLRFSRNFRVSDDLRITPSIGATWQDSKRVDYYYGVRPEEALPVRPAYNGRDTINISAGLAGAFRLHQSWSLLGGVFTTRLGNGIADSPIVTRRYSTMAYGGAGWRF